MRKCLLALVSLVLVCGLAFAATNSQKIYSVDSDVYKDISTIYVLTGHALPSTTGPWSGDELSKMIEAIDRDEVPSYLQGTYDNVIETLGAKADLEFNGGAMSFNGTVNLELYFHTYDVQSGDAYKRTDTNGLEDHAFEGRSWWYAKDLNQITPFFKLEWESWLNDHFYSAFDLSLQNAARGNEFGELGSTKLNTNVIMLQNLKFDLKVLDIASFPHRAFVAVGGDGWSIEAGRDRLSWGAGTTGNVVLSDNFPYHDMVRATAYGERFKYTYLISFFPAKQNYYNTKGHTGYTGTGNNNSTNVTMDGLFFYSAHRFDFRLFKDKVGFTLTEGLVYMSETNNVQFAALSPLYFMHNAYIANSSNSTLALELNYTPIKGLNIYGQMLLDQFTMPGFEDPVGADKDYSSAPNGIAYLAGAKYMTGIQEGVLTVNPEFAYVTPYCYLRDSADSTKYGMDYVGAIRSRLYGFEDRGLGTDILYEDYVIGYTYGPDSLVANLSASWEGEKLSFSAKGMFMVHGTHDLWTKWTEVPAHTSEEAYKTQYSGTTSSHAASGNYRYEDAQTARNAKWTTLDIGVGASYEIIENLELNLNVDFVSMKNIFNIKGQDASDVQIIFGAKYECF